MYQGNTMNFINPATWTGSSQQTFQPNLPYVGAFVPAPGTAQVTLTKEVTTLSIQPQDFNSHQAGLQRQRKILPATTTSLGRMNAQPQQLGTQTMYNQSQVHAPNQQYVVSQAIAQNGQHFQQYSMVSQPVSMQQHQYPVNSNAQYQQRTAGQFMINPTSQPFTAVTAGLSVSQGSLQPSGANSFQNLYGSQNPNVVMGQQMPAAVTYENSSGMLVTSQPSTSSNQMTSRTVNHNPPSYESAVKNQSCNSNLNNVKSYVNKKIVDNMRNVPGPVPGPVPVPVPGPGPGPGSGREPVHHPKISIRTVNSINTLVEQGSVSSAMESVGNPEVPPVTGEEQFEDVFYETPLNPGSNINQPVFEMSSNDSQTVPRTSQQQERSNTVVLGTVQQVTDNVVLNLLHVNAPPDSAPSTISYPMTANNKSPSSAATNSHNTTGVPHPVHNIQSMNISRNSQHPNPLLSKPDGRKDNSRPIGPAALQNNNFTPAPSPAVTKPCQPPTKRPVNPVSTNDGPAKSDGRKDNSLPFRPATSQNNNFTPVSLPPVTKSCQPPAKRPINPVSSNDGPAPVQSSLPVNNKSPPLATGNLTPKPAAQATNATPVIAAVHRLPKTVQKPMTNKIPNVIQKPNIDLNQSRLSLQASVLSKSQAPTGNIQSSDGKSLESAKKVESSSSANEVPASSSLASRINGRKDGIPNANKLPKVSQIGKQKEVISNEKQAVGSKESEPLSVSSILQDFLKGKSSSSSSAEESENEKSDKNDTVEKESNKTAIETETETPKEKENEAKKGEKSETNIDVFLINEITDTTKKLKTLDKMLKEEQASPNKSLSSIESSVNCLQTMLTGPEPEEEKKKSQDDMPNEINLELPIKKKPGPKSRTMPAYMEQKKKLSERDNAAPKRKDELSHVCCTPEKNVTAENAVKIPEENNAAKKPEEKNSAENTEEKKLEENNAEKNPKRLEESILKKKIEKDKIKKKIEKDKIKKKILKKHQNNVLLTKQNSSAKKPDTDWVEKLKRSADHFLSTDEPPQKKSREVPKTKSKHQEMEEEVPQAKRPMIETEVRPSSSEKDQNVEMSSSESADELEARQKKLEMLKKLEKLKDYLNKDENRDTATDLSMTDRHRSDRSCIVTDRSSDEESSRRRKISKTKVIKNKNIEREQIALVSKDFTNKLASTKQDEKNMTDSKTTCKIGAKNRPEIDQKSPERLEADSSMIDESDGEKKTDEDANDDNNNTQSSSIDDDLKPDIAGISGETPMLSPARITSTSEDVDLVGLLRAFQSVDQHRCMFCAKTLDIQNFWINAKSTELKCTGCLSKAAPKNVCYNQNHEDEIKKLKLQLEELKNQKKKKKLKKKKAKESDLTIQRLFSQTEKMLDKILMDSSGEEEDS